MAKKNLKVDLVIIDPQNDFMGEDDGNPLTQTVLEGDQRTSLQRVKDLMNSSTINVAALPVKGAVSDARRGAGLIDRVGRKLNDIHVTLDSHHTMHIAHPDMWLGADGKQPAPFTIIRADDMKSGMWRARNPGHQKKMYDYLVALEATRNFLHCIWPPHCRIGTWGHGVQKDLEAALTRWERSEMGVVDVVTKGSNVWREHFGGLMAEVIDPNDPSTQLYTPLITTLQDVDMIGIFGWASSHCVKRTVEQLADNIGDEHVKKMVLITDCMSPVPAIPNVVDFPAIAAQFLKDMQARGMKLMTSDEFLA